jgi:hypothetical protein
MGNGSATVSARARGRAAKTGLIVTTCSPATPSKQQAARAAAPTAVRKSWLSARAFLRSSLPLDEARVLRSKRRVPTWRRSSSRASVLRNGGTGGGVRWLRINVETVSDHGSVTLQANSPLTARSPVGALHRRLDGAVEPLLALLDAQLGGGDVSARLREALAHVLWEVQVARLVDDVKAALLGGAVVEEVDGRVGARGAGGQQRGRGGKAGEDLCRGVYAARRCGGQTTELRCCGLRCRACRPSSLCPSSHRAAGLGRRGADHDGGPAAVVNYMKEVLEVCESCKCDTAGH